MKRWEPGTGRDESNERASERTNNQLDDRTKNRTEKLPQENDRMSRVTGTSHAKSTLNLVRSLSSFFTFPSFGRDSGSHPEVSFFPPSPPHLLSARETFSRLVFVKGTHLGSY